MRSARSARRRQSSTPPVRLLATPVIWVFSRLGEHHHGTSIPSSCWIATQADTYRTASRITIREPSGNSLKLADLPETERKICKGQPGALSVPAMMDGTMLERGFLAWAPYDDNLPDAVVFCESAADVSNAVSWARGNNTSLRVRCGRHNYEASSSLVRGGIIIDVTDMNAVSVSDDRSTAAIGAGIRMADLYQRLNSFDVTLPLATARSVWASLVSCLAAGSGSATRKWGLTCDSLVSVEMVLADGSIVMASDAENPDLFWACRGGGGGNFGIATSFTFNVHKVSNVALFTVSYDWGSFAEVVDRFQRWIETVDAGITAYLTLVTVGLVQLQGQFTANDNSLMHTAELLGPMLDPGLGPVASTVQIMPHAKATQVILGIDSSMPQWLVSIDAVDQIFKSTSAFVYDLLPPEAITILKHQLESAPGLSEPPSEPSMVVLLGGGGDAARQSPTDTAAYHRQARFLVQYDAYWTAPQDSDASIAWIKTFRDQMSTSLHPRRICQLRRFNAPESSGGILRRKPGATD